MMRHGDLIIGKGVAFPSRVEKNFYSRSLEGCGKWAKCSLRRLRGYAKGLPIGLHFFEHFTLQINERSPQVAYKVAKSGHGL
jgi:hypothetical protein